MTMSMDTEIRRILAERHQERISRSSVVPILRYHIMGRMPGLRREVPLEKGEFADEQEARSRMEKLSPRRGNCFTLYDIFRKGGPHGGIIMSKGDCGEPAKEGVDLECVGGCYSLNDLFERATGVPDDQRRLISARKIWLSWLRQVKRVVAAAEDEGWSKSSFAADVTTKKLRGLLGQFCKGQVPVPQEEAFERFGALFELVLPSKTMGYPTGMAYSAQPVGSLHGIGVSPSAAGDIEAGRYQNYVDGGTISRASDRRRASFAKSRLPPVKKNMQGRKSKARS